MKNKQEQDKKGEREKQGKRIARLNSRAKEGMVKKNSKEQRKANQENQQVRLD